MSQDKEKIFRRVVNAFNDGDMFAAASVLDRESEWDWSRSVGPTASIYRGPDEILGFWEEFTDNFEDITLEIEEMVEAEELLVAGMLSVMRGRGGIEVSARNGWVVTFRGDKLSRLEMFQGLPEALEAAGLSE